MVKINQVQLQKTFQALSDPTRLSIVERLSEQPLTINILKEPYSMSAPAISKHLRVLEDAKLISRTRKGREVEVELNTKSLTTAKEWFEHYQRFWNNNLDQLEQHLLSNK